MVIITANVIQLFIMDTFIASCSGQSLQDYMIKKHAWTKQEYFDMKEIYMNYLMLSKKGFEIVAFEPTDVTSMLQAV
jgi:hypothetical protein